MPLLMLGLIGVNDKISAFSKLQIEGGTLALFDKRRDLFGL